MKTTCGKLVEAYDGHIQPMAQKRFRGVIAMNILEVKKAVEKSLASFLATRDEKVKEFGDNGAINPASKGWPEFVAEYEPMLKEEVDFHPAQLKPLALEVVEISADGIALLSELGILPNDEKQKSE